MTINRFRYLIRNSLRSIGGNRVYATLYVEHLGLLPLLPSVSLRIQGYHSKHPIDIERV